MCGSGCGRSDGRSSTSGSGSSGSDIDSDCSGGSDSGDHSSSDTGHGRKEQCVRIGTMEMRAG